MKHTRWIALLLTLAMVLGLMPMAALAAEEESRDSVIVNAEVGDVIRVTGEQEAATLNTTYYDNLGDAGQVLRKAMVERKETCTVSIVQYAGYNLTEDMLLQWGNSLIDWALVYPSDPDAGDYLYYHLAYAEYSVDGFVSEDYYAFLDYTFHIIYTTTADQEAAVDAKVNSILKELDINNLNHYDRITAIYDYVCSNVSYEGIVTEDTEIVKITAYGALVEGAATDYGIALALYRLLEEALVSSRVLYGSVDGQQRYWNSVDVDGFSYFADAALDAGQHEYKYLLKGTESMPDHILDESLIPDGNYGYYIRSNDFGPDFGHQYSSSVTREPTCVEPGIRTYTCACGYSYEEEIPVSGHTGSKGTVTKAATCTEAGLMSYVCDVCGDDFTDKIPALGHDYSEIVPAYREEKYVHNWKCIRCDSVSKTESCTFDAGTVVKEATLDEFGVKKHTCTVCGGSYESASIYRISGAGRVETALAAAELLKETLKVSKFDTIIIANGDNFADALTGSYLAAQKKAPILLYRASGAALNEAYIRDNLSSNGIVYILGGPVAMPESVETSLRSQGYTVVRLAGKDRFDTNLKILEEAGVSNEEILVCTGWEFADSLSASATGLPILMVNSNTGKLTDGQIAFLQQHAGNDFTVIGGPVAVSENLMEAIDTQTTGTVSRLYGSSREVTSANVAQRYFGTPERVLLAYSRNFPDGLCGGPLAHALGAPLLLINKNNESAAAEYVAAKHIGKGAILGGTAAVSDASGMIVFDLQ